MDIATRRGLVRAGRIAFALATVVAVVLVVRGDLGELTDVDLTVRPGWMAAGAVVAAVGAGRLPRAFRRLLEAQGQRRLALWSARRLWWRSQVARFLPTGVAGMAARVVMAGDLGLSRRAASAAMGQEIAQVVGWSTLVAGAGVLVTGAAPRILGAAAAVAAAAGLAALPVVLQRVDRRTGLTTSVPVAWRATGQYGVVVAIKALRAVVVGVAAGVPTEHLLVVVAADAAGQVAGTLSIAPSGIGTREAGFIAVAGPSIGVGRAVSLAVVLRVLDLAVELGWVGWVSLRRGPDERPVTERVPRVVHLSSSWPRHEDDHVAPFLLDLVGVQRDAGWEVTVVATHDAGLPRVHEVAGVTVERFRYAPDRHEVLAYRGGGHASLQARWHVLLIPGLLVAEVWALLRALRRHRPDVVVAHWLAPSGIVAALLAGRAPHTVLTLHGNDVALAAKVGPVARWAARRADQVACISDGLAREVEDVLRLPTGSVAVTRLPLPGDLRPTPLPSGPTRVLAAGRASSEKGFDVLLDALARPELADLRCTLVGEGPARPDLERRAAALGDRVTLLPALPRRELFRLVQDHHVVAVPSRREGLGLFALECLALGRQVVASDVGGLPEVVRGAGDGALVPPDDPAALAQALASLHLAPPTDPQAVAAHRPEAVLRQFAAAYGLPDPGGTSDRTADASASPTTDPLE